MIHKVKALYDEGKGLSKRQIARELQISRSTVSKYLAMEVKEIGGAMEEALERRQKLDKYKTWIVHLLQSYPQLSAVKVLRKLQEKDGSLQISSRSVRRYVEKLRQVTACRQERYYQPVLDMVPGVQCQIDPGELRGVRIGGEERAVHFVVFVLSFSRLMYVGLSKNPLNTRTFIELHDRAFRYFGGCTQECVYDQTKMVVIREEYRELDLNAQFYEYATHAGFTIRACEGYDPESKGKVEAGVKFVKYNGLYGEDFADWSALESFVADWLDNIANARTHGTTGRIPRELYEEEEQHHMRSYNCPSVVHPDGLRPIRKADKTGLISWKSNKYSVPLVFQRAFTAVEEQAGELVLYDPSNGQEIARHIISLEKGKIIQNTHHYRDKEEQAASLEKKIGDRIGEPMGTLLCQAIKRTMPKAYKDQLRGVLQIFASIPSPVEPSVLERLCQRRALTASAIKEYLTAYACRQKQQETKEQAGNSGTDNLLADYGQLTVREVNHAVH